MRRLLVIAVLVCLAPNASVGGRPLRVLFIGNSLTYTNDLPAVVAALAKASDAPRLDYDTLAYPDYSLEDHWDRGEARRRIARGRWDVVVLQQGPSASAEGREVLLDYARRFAGEIRRVGARPALYMVWPSAARDGDFERSSESYRLAAEEVDGILLPAGDAWRAAWRRDPTLRLYSSDGLHPTPEGTYLAALVVYEGLYGGPPTRLPALKDSADQVPLLQAAATEAAQKSGRR